MNQEDPGSLIRDFDKFFEEWKKQSKEYEDLVFSLYDKKKLKVITRFILDSRSTPLETLCSQEMRDFLFNNEGSPLFQRDEPSMKRSEYYGEKDLFCSYYYQDPRETCFKPSSTHLDMIIKRTAIPQSLRKILENLDFFPKEIIDFEILEFPHYTEEGYYGPSAELVRKVQEATNISNKKVSRAYKENVYNLFRDIEKLHIKFVVGFGQDQNIRFIPIYIGVGTNQPYGFSFKGPIGKQRFIKYRFDESPSGIETGILKETPMSIEDVVKDCQEPEFIFSEAYDENSMIWILRDRGNKYSDRYDENRFKGFVRMPSKGASKNVSLVKPEYDLVTIPQEKYFSSVLNGSGSLEGRPVIRSMNDLFGLVNRIFPAYENFAALEFDPFYVVKRIGVDKAYDHVKTKLGKGWGYVDAFNVASDIFQIGVEDFERLKRTAILMGCYIKSGKFEELLNNTSNGIKTQPL